MKSLLPIFLSLFVFAVSADEETDAFKKTEFENELRDIWENVYLKKKTIKNEELEKISIIETFAENTNDADLFYHIGVVYMNIPNSVAALKWMEMAADQKHPQALHNIGWWYDNGFGHINEDNDKAVEYYRLAYWQGGVARSFLRLAEMYLYGDGVNKDTKLARGILLTILKDSSNLIVTDHNIADTEFYLGKIYRYAIGVDIDLDKSFDYFISAAGKGHEQSMVESAQLLRQKYRETGNEQQNKEAEKLYKLAAAKGNTGAMLYLSAIYYEKYSKEEDTKINEYKFFSWIYSAYKIGIEDERLKQDAIRFVKNFILNDDELKDLLDKQTDECIENNFKDCF